MKITIKTFILGFLFLLIINCKEEKLLTDENASLAFSEDTIFFDTVFTTIGTTTQWLKIYNKYDQYLEVSKIYLAGGNGSVFRMNIDGKPAREVTNKRIPPKDSLFILIEATIDPNGGNLPLFIKDSIVFITNNNIQDVKLVAWGQDVHYYSNEYIETETWNSDKPYLIYNNLVVDSNETLTINEGVQVYLHWKSSLVVLGTLVINGTKEKPVIFQGDRLEPWYDDAAGQWWAIALVYGSANSKINYLVVKNATTGIQLGVPCQDQTDDVIITNTIIQNCSAFGIYAFGANLQMYNSLICNSGLSNFYVQKGGNYSIYQSTIASGGSTKYPSVILSNYTQCYYINKNYNDTLEYIVQDLQKASFINSIIYGSQKTEFDIAKREEGGFNYNFNNCLIKLNKDSFDINNTEFFRNNIYNSNPKFIDASNYNFELDTLSPAKDMADPDLIIGINILDSDLNDTSRFSDIAPDLGPYERFE